MLEGILSGERVLNLAKFSLAWSLESRLISIIKFGMDKRKMKDSIGGEIYEATEE